MTFKTVLMKNSFYLLLVFISLKNNLSAQKNMEGEYVLEGVREMACAFKLNSDSTFEFYFSYGALDRYGSGKWAIDKDNIIFTGKPPPGKDYKLVSTLATNSKFPVLKIEDKNTYLYRLVYCRLLSSQYDTIIPFNDNGIVNLPYAVDSIQLLSDLCPEKESSFILESKPLTYTFNFEPWILEVFFNGNTFHYEDGFFEGSFPLLQSGRIYRFAKQTD